MPQFLKSTKRLRPGRAAWPVCLALLGACGGDAATTGATTVAGRVVAQHSRRPVGGGAVQVYRASSGGGYRPVGDPQPCDAQGRFRFGFDAAHTRGYLLRAESPPGYLTDWAAAPHVTAGRANDDVVVPVLAPAWVRLVLVDEPPHSRVLMTVTGYAGAGEQFRYPADTVLVRPLLADFKTLVTWFVYEAGAPDRKAFQAIQPGSLDTVTVRIPF